MGFLEENDDQPINIGVTSYHMLKQTQIKATHCQLWAAGSVSALRRTSCGQGWDFGLANFFLLRWNYIWNTCSNHVLITTHNTHTFCYQQPHMFFDFSNFSKGEANVRRQRVLPCGQGLLKPSLVELAFHLSRGPKMWTSWPEALKALYIYVVAWWMWDGCELLV